LLTAADRMKYDERKLSLRLLLSVSDDVGLTALLVIVCWWSGVCHEDSWEDIELVGSAKPLPVLVTKLADAGACTGEIY